MVATSTRFPSISQGAPVSIPDVICQATLSREGRSLALGGVIGAPHSRSEHPHSTGGARRGSSSPSWPPVRCSSPHLISRPPHLLLCSRYACLCTDASLHLFTSSPLHLSTSSSLHLSTSPSLLPWETRSPAAEWTARPPTPTRPLDPKPIPNRAPTGFPLSAPLEAKLPKLTKLHPAKAPAWRDRSR